MQKKISKLYYFSKSSYRAFILVGEIFIGFFITLAALYLFIDIAENIVRNEAISIDILVTHIVFPFRNPVLTDVMHTITFFGGQDFIGFAIIATIFFLLLKGYKKDALIFSFILFFGIALNLLLKILFQRPRPTLLPLAEESTYSFPSGHAMNSFIFFTCLSFFIFRKMKNTKLKISLIVLSIFIIGLIGLSRIYLGVHFFSDVVAGYLAGLCWFVLVLLFDKTLLFLNLFKRFEFEKKY